MGIGNRRPDRGDQRLTRTHYPSWGLGTRVWVNRHIGHRASLPLMGIGNLRYLSDTGKVDWLITPHGDWELAGERLNSSLTGCSLPLMGIGNP